MLESCFHCKSDRSSAFARDYLQGERALSIWKTFSSLRLRKNSGRQNGMDEVIINQTASQEDDCLTNVVWHKRG